MTLMERVVSTARYNAALEHPVVGVTLRHLARKGVRARSSAIIEQLSALQEFPNISVGALLAAAKAAGAPMRGVALELTELDQVPLPILAYLRTSAAPGAHVDLIQIERLGRTLITISSDRFGVIRMKRVDVERRWSGVVLLAGSTGPSGMHHSADPERRPDPDNNSETEVYQREVLVIEGLLSRAECTELIAYCEAACFRRSRVGQPDGRGRVDVVATRIRSSSSANLTDRTHPILARLYAMCAEREGVRPEDIEDIQCVRYKRGQRFRAHFDGGVDLPRLTTYLTYLNDDFEGGETYFPMLKQLIAPRAGNCLRFPSCDRDGRILWQSEHGGLPVSSGIKYALNIWVRCPRVNAPQS